MALMSVTYAQESTSFQINAAHTGGLSTTTAFAPPLKRLWTLNLSAPITYPIVAENTVIVNYLDPAGDDILEVASAKTGHILWKKTYKTNGSLSYAAYDNGVVFELSGAGILGAFQVSSGNILWAEQISPDYGFMYPPVASAGFVYITGQSGNIYQIDGQTGQVLWISGTSAQTSVSVGPGTIFFAVSSCGVEALSTSFGRLDWDKNAGSNCYSGYDTAPLAIPVGNLVFLPQIQDGVGTVFNAKTGAIVRTFNAGIPAFGNGLAYQENSLGIQASQANNGNILWTSSIPNISFAAPPIVVNSAVYALSTQGTLYALDAKAGTILQKIAAGSGPGESQFNSVTDLGAGQGILVVPSGKQLIAFAPMSKTTAPHK